MPKTLMNMAGKVASKGRFGDTMLLHVNPSEVDAIDRLHPGSITINPDTGQPEAWFWALLGKIGGAVAKAGAKLGGGLLDIIGKGSALGKDVVGAVSKSPEMGSLLGVDKTSNILGANVPKAFSVGDALSGLGDAAAGAVGAYRDIRDMATPEGLIGLAGEGLGVKPIYTEAVQDIVASRGPNEEAMPLDKYNRPASPLQMGVQRSIARQQVARQGGVKELVARRFGPNSPLTVRSYSSPMRRWRE